MFSRDFHVLIIAYSAANSNSETGQKRSEGASGVHGRSLPQSTQPPAGL